MTRINRIAVSEKPLFITIIIAVIITGTLTITSLRHTGVTNPTSIFCTFINSQPQSQTQTQLKQISIADVIIYYATARSTAQLTFSEIKLTADVIQTLTPCNLLVFGISHESLMWSSLNPRGTTIFLENDVTLIHKFLTDAPSLRVHHVTYSTQLSEADHLLSSYKTSPRCLPPHVFLKGNTWCKLALSKMPEEVYSREWDVIIIDGPKGYYGEAPGRMGPIFSAAVMARNREKGGDTHVFVHDVNRKVEKEYAQEFLCRNYLVNEENNLWYFKIPRGGKDRVTFC